MNVKFGGMGNAYCHFKSNLPHLGRRWVARQTLTSCLAGLPGTQPAPVPPPAACLGLMFPAQTPRWLVAATAPARPLGSCRHGGLLQAEAYFSPLWLQTCLAREESPEVKPQWEVWHPKTKPKVIQQ